MPCAEAMNTMGTMVGVRLPPAVTLGTVTEGFWQTMPWPSIPLYEGEGRRRRRKKEAEGGRRKKEEEEGGRKRKRRVGGDVNATAKVFQCFRFQYFDKWLFRCQVSAGR